MTANEAYEIVAGARINIDIESRDYSDDSTWGDTLRQCAVDLRRLEEVLQKMPRLAELSD